MKGRRGLTLVELTVTMLVIGIVGAVASLKYAEALKEHRNRACLKTVYHSLVDAQAGARTRGTPVTVQFQKNQAVYTITGLPNPTRPSAPYSINLATIAPGTKISDNYTVTFNGFGHPTATTLVEINGSGKKRNVKVDGVSGAITILPSS